MSDITAGQRLDLLAEIRTLLPDAEFTAEDGWKQVEIEFQDSCRCCSEYTTELCRLEVFVRGSIVEDINKQWKLRQMIEARVKRWAESTLEWNGCDCCEDDLYVNVNIFAKKETVDA